MTLSNDTFKRQIERIEGAFNYKLDVLAIPVWYEELKRNHITNTDLIAGVNEGVNPGASSHWTYRPTVIDLLTKCQYAKTERIKRDNKRIADQEDKAKAMGIGEILDRGCNNKSPRVRAWIDLTRQLLGGDIDKATFDKRHKEI